MNPAEFVVGELQCQGSFEDGPTFRISIPAGEGRQLIEELVNSFVVALWGDTCP